MNPMEFDICFAADDEHRGEHVYGTSQCTHVNIMERPYVGCNERFLTVEQCHNHTLCFWDKDGIDKWHEPGEPGCYDFHECNQMNNAKVACTTNKHCHYGHFGECLHNHKESQPFTEENWEGDPCRGYTKKACRQVDDQKREQKHFHCEWDAVNEWCVSPEIHLPHSDLCRSMHEENECMYAIRNERRCKWVPKEDNDFGGKCYGEWVAGADGSEGGPQRTTTSNKDFAVPWITYEKGYSKDDFEHGTFLHWQHHFKTDEEHVYTHDNVHYVDYDYGAYDLHDYANIHEVV